MSISKSVYVGVLWALVLAVPTTAAAETVYINDMLRVGVRTKPDGSLAPIAIVTTGDALEVLKKSNGYLFVEAENGVKGWINDAYATSEMPARRLITKVQAEKDRLAAEVERWREQAAAASAENDRLSARLDELLEENSGLQARATASSAPAVEGKANRWIALAGVMAGLLLFGFLLGSRSYRKKVAARFGGLTV